MNENADGRPDPLSYAFGYGRKCLTALLAFDYPELIAYFRACPGQDLAQNSVFIFVASILAAFRITKPCWAYQVNKKTIQFTYHFTELNFSHPDPFKCSIVVRTPETTKLIANQLMAFSTD
ncbi:hypothetical protein C8J57DRAFT_1069167 [Mycena rebaudengoi]|nr:hypothetical protein C8J57DRAFT_1069167 [Mycena rebaudengoi]